MYGAAKSGKVFCLSWRRQCPCTDQSRGSSTRALGQAGDSAMKSPPASILSLPIYKLDDPSLTYILASKDTWR